MNKYWPVIFWLYDVTDDGVLKYKPSAAHAKSLRWCYRESDAMLFGLSRIMDYQHTNLGNMPTFIVKVIKSETKPDVTPASTLRLLVQRIRLDN